MESVSQLETDTSAESILRQLAEDVNGNGVEGNNAPEAVKLTNKPLVYNYDDNEEVNEEQWSTEMIQAELEDNEPTPSELNRHEDTNRSGLSTQPSAVTFDGISGEENHVHNHIMDGKSNLIQNQENPSENSYLPEMAIGSSIGFARIQPAPDCDLERKECTNDPVEISLNCNKKENGVEVAEESLFLSESTKEFANEPMVESAHNTNNAAESLQYQPDLVENDQIEAPLSRNTEEFVNQREMEVGHDSNAAVEHLQYQSTLVETEQLQNNVEAPQLNDTEGDVNKFVATREDTNTSVSYTEYQATTVELEQGNVSAQTKENFVGSIYVADGSHCSPAVEETQNLAIVVENRNIPVGMEEQLSNSFDADTDQTLPVESCVEEHDCVAERELVEESESAYSSAYSDKGEGQLTKPFVQIEKCANEAEMIEEEHCGEEESRPMLVNRTDTPANPGQNFQNAILEDWDADGPPLMVPSPKIGAVLKSSADVNITPIEVELVHTFPPEVLKPANDSAEFSKRETEASSVAVPPTPTKGKARFYLSHFSVSRKEAIKEILNSQPAEGIQPILPKKDLILALELAKHSSPGVVNSKTEPDSKREILEILEGEQVGDWREVLVTSQEKSGHDLDVTRELNDSLQKPSNGIQSDRLRRRDKQTPSAVREAAVKRQKEKALERKIALEQLATEFQARSPRRKGTKDAPTVAAVDLERALASTPVLTGKRKRRPCYQPPSREEDGGDNITTNPSAIIKTYAPKRRSSDALNDVKTALKTIAIVNKHLSLGDEGDMPKELKTVKRVKKTPPQKKRARELQQLLGDEGAVRMLYDAAQKDAPLDGTTPRVFKKTKKGLMQQTKFVENAVLKSSGASEKSLRGKRLALANEESLPHVEPLFPPAAPGEVSNSSPPGRARKKPKAAEASRILYRHSSSESFDGSEGLRRSASEIAALDVSPERPGTSPARTEPSPIAQRKSSRPRKVSSKFSVYVAETLTPKKTKRNEGVRQVVEVEITQPHSSIDTELHEVKVETDEEQSVCAAVTSSPTPIKASKLSEEVRVSERDGLVEITLAPRQSSVKNGLTTEVLLDLQSALESAASNAACKAVLLTSEGEVFCQGIDLALLEPGSDVGSIVSAIKALVTTLATIEKPIIAGVQGPAVGMGTALLPLMDVVVASDVATFSTPYGRLGQGLEAASSFTFPRISKALVSELIFKGSILSAADAMRLGLVSQIIPASAFTSELSNVATAVASQSEQGLRAAKTLLTGDGKQGILEALDRECDALMSAWTNAECLTAAAEFLASGELFPNA